MNQMKQNQNETETEFANRLRNEILRSGNIFDYGNPTQMFIDGLNESIAPSSIMLLVRTQTYRF